MITCQKIQVLLTSTRVLRKKQSTHLSKAESGGYPPGPPPWVVPGYSMPNTELHYVLYITSMFTQRCKCRVTIDSIWEYYSIAPWGYIPGLPLFSIWTWGCKPSGVVTRRGGVIQLMR